MLAISAASILVVVSKSSSPNPSILPHLFLDLDDAEDTWGIIVPKAASVQIMSHLKAPSLNYSKGDTIFATATVGDTFEVFAAVGRPGEPLVFGDEPNTTDGVAIYRFTSSDLRTWS